MATPETYHSTACFKLNGNPAWVELSAPSAEALEQLGQAVKFGLFSVNMELVTDWMPYMSGGHQPGELEVAVDNLLRPYGLRLKTIWAVPLPGRIPPEETEPEPVAPPLPEPVVPPLPEPEPVAPPLPVKKPVPATRKRYIVAAMDGVDLLESRGGKKIGFMGWGTAVYLLERHDNWCYIQDVVTAREGWVPGWTVNPA